MPPRRTQRAIAQYNSSIHILTQVSEHLGSVVRNAQGAPVLHPNGVPRTVLSDMLAEAPLPTDQTYTEEHALAFKRRMETGFTTWIQTDNFHLYAGEHRPCAFQIARRLAVRSCQLLDPIVLNAMEYFPTGITADARWFLLERTGGVRKGMVRAPFDMTAMDKHFRVALTDHMIHLLGTVKLRQKNLPDGAFSFENSPSARAYYHAVVIHTLNYYGLLYDNVSSSEECRGFDGAQAALSRSRIERFNPDDEGSHRVIRYETHDDAEEFFHKDVWPNLVLAIVTVARALTA